MEVNKQTPFLVEDWQVDPASARMTRDGKTIKLEPRVMDVLVYLASRPGQVVSRDDLEANVWVGRVISYDALTSTVQKLRRAFADDARQPRIIETLSKRGYRLLAPVSFPDASHQTDSSSENVTHAPRYNKPWVLARTVITLIIGLAILAAVMRFGPWEIPADLANQVDHAQFHSRPAV